MQRTYQVVRWGWLGVRYQPHLLPNAAHPCSGLGARLGAAGRLNGAHPCLGFPLSTLLQGLRGFLLTLS